MRILLAIILALGICGCTKVKQDPEPAAQNSDDNAQDTKPKGRAPGGVAGMILPGEDDPIHARGNGGNSGNNSAPAAPPREEDPIPKVESRIVEWPKYKQENPNVVEADTKVKGFDPFSAAASAYVNIPAKLETLAGGYNARLQSQLNALDGSDPKPLSFEEFKKNFKQAGGKFKNQRPYRLYGYNPKTGKVVVLEDKALKKQIYEEKGIPWDE